jgi:hypothetical protein
MNAIPFDTLKMARKLEAAGFPGPQAAGAAEAMAEAMSGAELATKADLMAVKADVMAVKADLLAAKTDLERQIAHESGLIRTELTREIGLVRSDMTREFGLVRAELTHEIGSVRTELTHEIGSVRTDMTAMETRLSSVIARVSSDLEILRRDMTIRLGAIAVASTGVMLAAMRFMLPHP